MISTQISGLRKLKNCESSLRYIRIKYLSKSKLKKANLKYLFKY